MDMHIYRVMKDKAIEDLPKTPNSLRQIKGTHMKEKQISNKGTVRKDKDTRCVLGGKVPKIYEIITKNF